MKFSIIKSTIAILATCAVSSAMADGHLSLAGKRIGVAVVGTQHFWDREAFNGATSTVEKLGGEVVPVDGGRDNQVHADNHDILLANKVDAVISILGDGAVEPKFEALKNAGIPVFTVDHPSPHGINNTTSDNYYMGDNIPGKPRATLFWFGGFPFYRKQCRLAREEWRGFEVGSDHLQHHQVG